jgi:hypothetical protein
MPLELKLHTSKNVAVTLTQDDMQRMFLFADVKMKKIREMFPHVYFSRV